MIFRPIVWWWILAVPGALCVAAAVMLVLQARGRRARMPWLWLRRVGLVTLLLVLALRPSIPGGQQASGSSLLDVVVVVDRTLSSLAEDYNGGATRLSGMQADIKELLAELPGARVMLISFSNTATVDMPLTDDTTALQATVDSLVIQDADYATGSSIDGALPSLTTALQRISHDAPDRRRLVVYMGDGEQTAAKTPASFAAVKQYVDGGMVLGYGTAAGGKISPPDPYHLRTEKYLRYSDPVTYEYSDVISKLDEPALQKIAADMGVAYVHRQAPGGMAQIMNSTHVQSVINDAKKTDAYVDTYWMAAPVVMVALGLELWPLYVQYQTIRRLRRVKEGVSHG